MNMKTTHSFGLYRTTDPSRCGTPLSSGNATNRANDDIFIHVFWRVRRVVGWCVHSTCPCDPLSATPRAISIASSNIKKIMATGWERIELGFCAYLEACGYSPAEILVLEYHVRPMRKQNVGARFTKFVVKIDYMIKASCCARNRECPLRSRLGLLRVDGLGMMTRL